MLIKGPGKRAKVNTHTKNMEQLVKNRKLHLNLNNFLSTRNRNFNYTAWNNKKLIGFALLKPANKNSIEIELIVTKSMGQGIGKQLMNQIKMNALAKKFKTINLVSLPNAKPFYIKQKFTPVDEYKFQYALK